MVVGEVIAGHDVTPFLQAAESAGCNTANGGHTVEAAQAYGGLHAVDGRFLDA
jgi:shikimate dehydrogenase